MVKKILFEIIYHVFPSTTILYYNEIGSYCETDYKLSKHVVVLVVRKYSITFKQFKMFFFLSKLDNGSEYVTDSSRRIMHI